MTSQTRKNLIRLSVLTVLFVSAVSFWISYRESIALNLLGRLREFSKTELPFTLDARGLTIRLISPMAELSQITAEVKPEFGPGLSRITIGSVRAQLDFLQALAGRVHLSSVVLQDLEFEIDLDELLKNPSEDNEIPWPKIFAGIRKFPLSRFAAFGVRIKLFSNKRNISFRTQDADIIVNLQKDRMGLDVAIHKSHVQFPNQSVAQTTAQFNALISKQGITLHSSLLEMQNSRISLSGSLNLPKTIDDLEGNLIVQSSLQTEDLIPPLKLFLKKIPDARGGIEVNGRLGLAGKSPTGQFLLKTNNLVIDNFIVDHVELEGIINNQTFSTKKALWTSEMGDVQLENISFKLQDDFQFEFSGGSDGLDLRRLLVQVTAGDVPVEMFLEPQVSCKGLIEPKFELSCQAKVRAEHLEVRSDDLPKSTIVIVDDFSAHGEFKVTEEQVEYTANLELDQNRGTSKGSIHYENGFQISFATERLDFKNIYTLAGLSVVGSAAIKGTTQGDSRAATFNLDFNGQEISFEKYFLGAAKGLVSYKSGWLYFQKISGQVGDSEYSGDVAIDLLNERVKASGQSPKVTLTDLTRVFSELVQLPVTPEGIGKVNVSAEGPLDFSRLSYNLQSQFEKVTVIGEVFPSLDFNVVSDKGEVRITKAEVKKGKGRIQMRGSAKPNAQVQVDFRGENLFLEDSENINRLDANISGKVTLEARMTGHVLRPSLLIDTAIRNLVIDEQEFADSKAVLGVNPQGVMGDINLFAGRLISEIQLPFTKESPFLLDVNANDWEFATIFTIIGGGKLVSEYDARLSGKLRLDAATGGLFNSTGQGTIQKLLLKRGPLLLENLTQMQLKVKNGIGHLQDFKLRGPNSKLELIGENFSYDSLNLGIAGDLDLRLLNIFFPFMDEIGGRAQVKTQLTGPLLKPEILGNVLIKNGYVKIKNFPHAFEKIDSNTEFSKSRVNINRIDGFLGGGVLQGQGSILINGYRNLPTDIGFKLTGTTLTIPAGVQSSGSANLRLTGDWFPFLLSGDYNVDRGLFSREFTDASGTNLIQQSSYLPKMILKSAFEPLNLNLNIKVDRNFSVKNSMVDGSAKGELNIKGTPTLPALLGSIELEKNTKLLLRDKVFEATAGSAKFNGSTEINPEIYVTARSRVQEYDISMILQGNAKNALPRLTSIPPLSETDIITLLALGVTSENLEKKVKNVDQESSTSYQLGSAIIENNPLAKSVFETLGVNFQFSSSYDDESGAAIKKFTFTRKISDRLRASVTRAEGQQITTEGKINYQIDSNWSAVGTVENREASDSSVIQTDRSSTQSIFGLDLDFRREFR